MSPKFRYILLSICSSLLLVGFIYFVVRTGGDLSKRLVDMSFERDTLTTVGFLVTMVIQAAMTFALVVRETRRNATQLKSEVVKLMDASLRATREASNAKADSHARAHS